jgi:FMN phosphatase YigB (HAD superfamily)
MALTAQDRARKIKIILFDVDGVLTDGTIWLVPGPAGGKVLEEIGSKTSIGFGVNRPPWSRPRATARTTAPRFRWRGWAA